MPVHERGGREEGERAVAGGGHRSRVTLLRLGRSGVTLLQPLGDPGRTDDDGTVAPIAPVRTDGVVTLRAFRPDDVDDMVVMGRDPASARYTSVPQPYDRRHAEQWVAGPGAGLGSLACWAVEAPGDDGVPRFAGTIDIREGPPPAVGYLLAPWARGRGHMARAVRLATRWAFDEAGLPVVHWNAHVGNLASWRVAHACGFTFRGAIPLSVRHRGELRDAWHATLLATDDGRPRTTWWPTPALEGPTVRLRPTTDADVPRIVELDDGAWYELLG